MTDGVFASCGIVVLCSIQGCIIHGVLIFGEVYMGVLCDSGRLRLLYSTLMVLYQLDRDNQLRRRIIL